MKVSFNPAYTRANNIQKNSNKKLSFGERYIPDPGQNLFFQPVEPIEIPGAKSNLVLQNMLGNVRLNSSEYQKGSDDYPGDDAAGGARGLRPWYDPDPTGINGGDIAIVHISYPIR